MEHAPQYRTRPVVVEAMRFDGGAANASPIIDWILRGGGTARWHAHEPAWESSDGSEGHPEVVEHIRIDAVGTLTWVIVGHWIVKDLSGHFIVCPPDIFEQTYEAL